jgi:hypothetical protein
MTIDSSLLLSLLTADPAQRDAQVTKLLQQQLVGGGSGPDLSGFFDQAGVPSPPAPTEPSAAATRLYREAQLLDEEVRRLLALVADVAAALGACPRCLGTEESCNVCGGHGTSGTNVPDRDRFTELVAPAVVRLADEEGAVDTS